MRMGYAPLRFALVAALCTLAGCGLVPRDIDLSYAVPKRRHADKSVSIAVEKFKDDRPQKTELCMSNAPQIFLREGADPGNWIGTAVAEELKADGYKVTYHASEPRASGPVLVSGSIRSLACGEYRGRMNPTHWVEITVAISVDRKGTKIFDDTFSIRIGGVVHITANAEYTNLFERAARTVLRKAIPALTEAIDRTRDI